MTKELNTFHTGKYLLSADICCDTSVLNEALNVFMRMPLFPNTVAHLNDNQTDSFVFAEAKLEENPATYEQVCRITKHARENFSQDTSAIEVINIFEAHNLALKNIGTALTPELLASFHKELTASLPNIKETNGAYRNGGVKADGKYLTVNYTPPASTLDINFLVKNLFDWLENDAKTLNPIIKAILLHLHIKKIQPFSNANGHLARIMEMWYLKKSGIKFLPYMLSGIYKENKDEYYKCVSEFYSSSDINPFLKFISANLEKTVTDIRDANYSAMSAVISDAYLSSLLNDKSIIKRQYDFLCIIRESGEVFTQEDLQLKKQFTKLYGKVSRTTVSRDIKKFEEMNLITTEGNGYIFNKAALA
jgi:Fic family protein